jgi:integrase/recombinase XerD
MPKNNRNGQAEIWNDQQFEAVMTELSPKMRAVFAICYFTCCRVSEALHLEGSDIVGDRIVFRRRTTKTKQTREVAIHPRLAEILAAAALPSRGYLFPGRDGQKRMTRQAADRALREVCDYLGLQGFSTHSNRRTAATRLNNQGVPLRVIQKIGGWTSLAALQRYLEVSDEQMDEAIGKL